MHEGYSDIRARLSQEDGHFMQKMKKTILNEEENVSSEAQQFAQEIQEAIQSI
jgi:DNA-binding MurR/RpiR family transcriptional regulator